MRFTKKWFLKMEYAFHMVDAYLYTNQGRMDLAADCKSRAYECERMLVWLRLQPR